MILSSNDYYTLTGTIKRSKNSAKKDTDVQVTIKKNLIIIDHDSESNDDNDNCLCFKITTAVFTLLWTIFISPFIFILAFVYSFYLGTITWHNIFCYVTSDLKNFFFTIIVSPFIILMYPLYIILCSLGLGLYASLVQISCKFSIWSSVVWDFEKGFYGWLCRHLSLEDCSPYELVILTDVQSNPASNVA